MSNEEAIKILSHTTNLGDGIVIEAMEGYTTRDIKVALDMAIKALEEKRYQGEWIKITSPLSTETVVKCPYCKDEFIGNDVEDYNCCPNCCARLINHVKED